MKNEQSNQDEIKSKKVKEVLQEDRTPPMQVDYQSDPITNFINNLKKQFRKSQGLGLFNLFRKKTQKENKKSAKAATLPDVIGPVKTVMKTTGHGDHSKVEIPLQKQDQPNSKISFLENHKTTSKNLNALSEKFEKLILKQFGETSPDWFKNAVLTFDTFDPGGTTFRYGGDLKEMRSL